MYEEAKEKFFGCTNQDMQQYYADKEANRPIDPKTLVKQQFVMNKNNAMPGKLHLSYLPFFVSPHLQLSQNKESLENQYFQDEYKGVTI